MRRAIIWVVLAIIALVTMFAQFDRQSRSDADYAGLVPPPFRGFAHHQLAFANLQQQDYAAAIEHARRLVRVRPLPAEHLSILARAELLSGDGEAAMPILEIAGTRGWRDPLVQLVLGESSLSEGDYLNATRRATALVATGTGGEHGERLTRAILSSPEGQEAFAAVLASDGRWRKQLERHLAKAGGVEIVEAIKQRAEVLREADPVS